MKCFYVLVQIPKVAKVKADDFHHGDDGDPADQQTLIVSRKVRKLKNKVVGFLIKAWPKPGPPLFSVAPVELGRGADLDL